MGRVGGCRRCGGDLVRLWDESGCIQCGSRGATAAMDPSHAVVEPDGRPHTPTRSTWSRDVIYYDGGWRVAHVEVEYVVDYVFDEMRRVAWPIWVRASHALTDPLVPAIARAFRSATGLQLVSLAQFVKEG